MPLLRSSSYGGQAGERLGGVWSGAIFCHKLKILSLYCLRDYVIMNNQDLISLLERNINLTYPGHNKVKYKEGRNKLMQYISDVEVEKKNNLILRDLGKYYAQPRKDCMQMVRYAVMLAIKEKDQSTCYDDLLLFLRVFFKRVVVTAFSLVLLYAALMFPFAPEGSTEYLPGVRAVFVNCEGNVYLNGEICVSGQLVKIAAGDLIQTDDSSVATLIYDDYSVIRLENATLARLNGIYQDQIELEEGSLWVNSPAGTSAESIKIATSLLRARLPKGALGITSKKNYTQLITTTASVELQVNSDEGTTELLTIPPDKSIIVRKNANGTRINELVLNKKSLPWVEYNKERDELHLDIVKKKTVEDKIATAGVLPGTVGDYVSKASSSFKAALSWDQDTKLQRQISDLDELFAEAFVLLEKDDAALSQDSLNSYRDKFLAIMNGQLNSVSSENFVYEEFPLVRLLHRHMRMVSPFSADDPQYVLNDVLEGLAAELKNTANAVVVKVDAEIFQHKILEAHKLVLAGDVDQSRKILRELLYLEKTLDIDELQAVGTDNMTVLDDIAKISLSLEALVREIKEIRIASIRNLAVKGDGNEIIGSTIAGKAYKANEDNNQEMIIDKSVKVVGQAIKDDQELSL